MNKMETIQDLIPNEHILNFHEGVSELPLWLGQGLRLMIGAGDLDHGNMPNLKMFSSYDVFFCLPWNNNGTSLRQNVEYLLANFNRTKLLCFIDYTDLNQMSQFSTLFKGRFLVVDGHGGHCPHLDFCCLQNILANGGLAMNIFEQSECLISIDEFEFMLANGHFKDYANINMVTSRICGEFDTNIVKKRLLNRVIELSTDHITIDANLLNSIDQLSLTELQYCYRSLLFDKQLPLNLKGSLRVVSRDWRSDRIELVITKVDPDFMIPKITAYVEKYGSTTDSERALYIIERILADLHIGSIFAHFKYDTFIRHMQKIELLANS